MMDDKFTLKRVSMCLLKQKNILTIMRGKYVEMYFGRGKTTIFNLF
jgi:hypothetical protein